MSGSLFLMIMIGVAWLVAWCCVDHSKPSKTWWPYAMRGVTQATPKSTGRQRQGNPQTTVQPVRAVRQHPNRRWQRSGS
jgi:hypothetical protein